jgi:hypothetical protein
VGPRTRGGEELHDTIDNMICQWEKCSSPAKYVYYDRDGEWVLCKKHVDRARTIDDIESGLKMGVLAGLIGSLF